MVFLHKTLAFSRHLEEVESKKDQQIADCIEIDPSLSIFHSLNITNSKQGTTVSEKRHQYIIGKNDERRDRKSK